jgi:hypothetical protein
MGKELKHLLLTIENELKEDPSRMYEASRKFPPGGTYLNYAEYKGPVRITAINGKGRGLLATKAVPHGTFVIASRAFDIVALDITKSVGAFDVNVQSRGCSSPAQGRLITSIANRLVARPELKKELYQLFAGKNLGYIESTATAPEADTNLVVDMQRIQGICDINSFGTDENSSGVGSYCGVWILPSYINHAW